MRSIEIEPIRGIQVTKPSMKKHTIHFLPYFKGKRKLGHNPLGHERLHHKIKLTKPKLGYLKTQNLSLSHSNKNLNIPHIYHMPLFTLTKKQNIQRTECTSKDRAIALQGNTHYIWFDPASTYTVYSQFGLPYIQSTDTSTRARPDVQYLRAIANLDTRSSHHSCEAYYTSFSFSVDRTYTYKSMHQRNT